MNDHRGIDVYAYDKLSEIGGQYSTTVYDFRYFRKECSKPQKALLVFLSIKGFSHKFSDSVRIRYNV